MKTETLMERPKVTTARAADVARTTAGALKIKNVLVPLDFSPASHAAIPFALPLLKRFGANLHLVHVRPVDSPISGLGVLPMVVPDVETNRRVRRDMGKAAENHAVKTQPGHLHLLRGSPFAEICELARKIDIDLIVMPTRGNTGLHHLVLGSTAERVVRYSPCPVLIIRSTKTDAGRNGKAASAASLGKLIVPIDFSDCSIKGLAYAKTLAREFGSTLVLLHSVHPEYYVTGDEYARYDLPRLMEQAEKAAQRQMQDLVAKTDWDGVKVEPVVEVGHPGQQICDRAQDRHADLIVTSTHGTTGLKHILLGSTAEFVVRHAQCPVLVVPTQERPSFK
jgi:nucleotide-binding universal stress UspA family protein